MGSAWRYNHRRFLHASPYGGWAAIISRRGRYVPHRVRIMLSPPYPRMPSTNAYATLEGSGVVIVTPNVAGHATQLFDISPVVRAWGCPMMVPCRWRFAAPVLPDDTTARSCCRACDAVAANHLCVASSPHRKDHRELMRFSVSAFSQSTVRALVSVAANTAFDNRLPLTTRAGRRRNPLAWPWRFSRRTSAGCGRKAEPARLHRTMIRWPGRKVWWLGHARLDTATTTPFARFRVSRLSRYVRA